MDWDYSGCIAYTSPGPRPRQWSTLGGGLTIPARGLPDGQRVGVRPGGSRSNEVSHDEPSSHLFSTVPRATRPCTRGVQSWCANGDSADYGVRVGETLG